MSPRAVALPSITTPARKRTARHKLDLVSSVLLDCCNERFIELGHSINDLKNAVNAVNASLEERSRRRGEELANRILGRGQKSGSHNQGESASPENKSAKDCGSGWGSDGW